MTGKRGRRVSMLKRAGITLKHPNEIGETYVLYNLEVLVSVLI